MLLLPVPCASRALPDPARVVMSLPSWPSSSAVPAAVAVVVLDGLGVPFDEPADRQRQEAHVAWLEVAGPAQALQVRDHDGAQLGLQDPAERLALLVRLEDHERDELGQGLAREEVVVQV